MDCSVKKQVLFRIVKTLDIVYSSFLYFTFSLLTSALSDHIFTSEASGHPTSLALSIFAQVAFIVSMLYFIRNAIHCFGSPFDNLWGTHFEHKRIKEIDGGVIAGFGLFGLCPRLLLKINKLWTHIEPTLVKLLQSL